MQVTPYFKYSSYIFYKITTDGKTKPDDDEPTGVFRPGWRDRQYDKSLEVSLQQRREEAGCLPDVIGEQGCGE